jgi:hypothetical protein
MDAKICTMIRRVTDRLVNEDLVYAVEEKIQENRQFTILSLSLHFPQISWSLHEIVSAKLHFWKLHSRWVLKMLTDEHEMAGQCVDLCDTIQ